ncbi:hydantoinase B/oxoprolinase family protein [Candidatus Electrothrix sp.]|uniref:hydantoinase B/oxoprolinase family protein n=1 Tax=Candidatus Electrothrix sp. TaxID=2170559 RepID=UPI0040579B61
MPATGQFRFSIDRGGTFTDVYAEVPGEPGFRTIKLLSEDPANYPDAPREGIRRILAEFGIPLQDGLLDSSGIEWIRMGTTVATNALLERKGARTALLTTKGFGDILQIGYQDRPDLFDLRIVKPDLLYEEVLEVEERLLLIKDDQEAARQQTLGRRLIIGSTGERFAALAAPDIEALQPRLQAILDQGISSVAIVFAHAYGCPEHEEQVGELARQLGFSQISLSSQVMPAVRLVLRGDTTLVDAYLTPHIRAYLDSFRSGFAGGLADNKLLFMQSDGGLAQADNFTGSRAVLSGPAGGVIGYGRGVWNPSSREPVIGFDMGGTSTDVSRFAGEPELTFANCTAGVRIHAPQLDIRTVAAGGGSRLFFDNGMFRVGPESAGAHPGPVCYRKNGSLTVTDANLVLGRLQQDYFPHIFGPDEDQPLDKEAACNAFAELTATINASYSEQGHAPLTVEEVALGFLRVADEVMVRPIREISVMRGFDIREHVLAVFGGAGAQHACSVARILGIRKVVVHRFSGILSACGMGMADTAVDRRQAAAAELGPKTLEIMRNELARLRADTEQELLAQGIPRERINSRCFLNLRYADTDTALMIEEPQDSDYGAAFQAAYQREFGFTLQDRAVLIDDCRVRSVGQAGRVEKQPVPKAEAPPVEQARVRVWFTEGERDTPLYRMETLLAGHAIPGPAILIQDTATIVVEPDCIARISSYGDVKIEVGRRQQEVISTALDPVRLSVFANLFMSIAEQMGRMLQKTAVSTNIRERLDFSCALFDTTGQLVANAPHVPVHLGAMSEAVQEQIRRCPSLHPGDVLVSNHPAAGGSHLPDITVITPVFAQDTEKIIFWVASRGHHADIGGISPGSMPPHSRLLSEEGAAIESFRLVQGGVFQEEGIAALLLKSTGPGCSGTRRLADNISDLRAQVAANQKGIDLILGMVEDYGLEAVHAYMGHVQDAAEAAVRKALCELSLNRGMAEQDTVEAVDYLDDGSPISLRLTIDRRDGSATFDFSGTGPELWGNLNAPKAVTRSALLYSLRCLVEKDIPLNHGCMIPVRLIIPPGSLLDPSPEAGVVGGNVLTSQRVVDVVLRAFGVAAASQGCMNNLCFGNEGFGYYETIGGGAGAGPSWHGQSGVHTHMTNTRITDPEILERRYPVLVREFALRRGSGGNGKYQGGDGLIRELEFLEPLQVSILSERRVFAPYGLNGGEDGKRGENIFIRNNGRKLNLGGKNTIQAEVGERLRICTPGGGGWGTL